MNLLIDSANCQVVGFVVATVGWILSITSMGHVEWRMWYMNSSSYSTPNLACVGMWKVCIYYYISYFDRPTSCHLYTYRDAYLPVSIRVGQHLLLAASILELLGKVSIIIALRKMFTRIHLRRGICHPFVVSGILNTVASTCILIAVIWNYKSVMNEEGISFPPSFHVPFKPDTQENGNAMLAACLASFMMMLSGLFHLTYKCSLHNPVHPEDFEL
ncbi:claudin-34 [Hipposideros larvatus]